MSNEMTIIPQLRFPEFLEKDGWEIKEVGEIFQVTRGYVLSMTLVKEVPTEEYPFPVFSSQTKNNGLAGYYNEYLYEDAITWTTDGANAGDVNYRDGKFYCTNVCGVLLNEEGFANPCIAELINSVSKKHVSYVGNPKLMNGVMSKIQIPVPSIPEQQKIASCLSSLDELLAAHNDKLDALKDHKKGLLQNLFPQEGETVPKVRFPEFEDDGEWVEKKLNTLSKRVIAKNRNGKFTAVFTNSATDGIVDQRDYFDKDIANKKNLENYFVVQNGDYVYNPRISEHAPVGPLFKNRLGKTGVMSPLYTVFRFNEKNNDFYEYYFQTSHWRNSIRAIANTGARFDRISITASLFMEIPVLYTGLMEQQKIASCLSAVDELITAQQEKIEQLQQHKKGLMQGLFPKIES